MSAALRVLSVAITAAAMAGAIAIGGGVPPSPARIAEAARDAARNTTEAARNTNETVERTRALAAIARNVRSQHRTSERMLRTQLEIEASSRDAAQLARDLAERISQIDAAAARLATGLGDLQSASTAVGATSEANARAARMLTSRLAMLARLFSEVTQESRELNQKARAYEQTRRGA